MKLGFLASHGGSNMQAIIDQCLSGAIAGKPVILICNNPNAIAVERARDAQLPVEILSGRTHANTDQLDRQMLRTTYQRTLETAPTNQAMTWSNPDSGNSGSVMATRTYYTETTVCREYTQEIMVGGTKQQGYGTACRMADGSWKIQG